MDAAFDASHFVIVLVISARPILKLYIVSAAPSFSSQTSSPAVSSSCDRWVASKSAVATMYITCCSGTIECSVTGWTSGLSELAMHQGLFARILAAYANSALADPESLFRKSRKTAQARSSDRPRRTCHIAVCWHPNMVLLGYAQVKRVLSCKTFVGVMWIRTR